MIPLGMAKRISPNLLVYTFAVLMILLRPYFAYQMSLKGAFSKDADAVTRILQRLIKKKENHSEDANEAAEINQAEPAEFILPFILLAVLRRHTAWLLSLLAELKVNGKRNTVFRISPTNDYFQLISRLQI